MKPKATAALAILKKHPANHITGNTVYDNGQPVMHLREDALEELFYCPEAYKADDKMHTMFAKETNRTQPTFSMETLRTAVEFGFRQAEKGNNLQMALENFNKLYT